MATPRNEEERLMNNIAILPRNTTRLYLSLMRYIHAELASVLALTHADGPTTNRLLHASPDPHLISDSLYCSSRFLMHFRFRRKKKAGRKILRPALLMLPIQNLICHAGWLAYIFGAQPTVILCSELRQKPTSSYIDLPIFRRATPTSASRPEPNSHTAAGTGTAVRLTLVHSPYI
jgi:hypothetical protein